MTGFLPVRSRVSFNISNVLFVASLLCLGLAEAFLIRGISSRPATLVHPHRRFDLPLLIWIPAFGEFLMLQSVRKHMRQGRLSPVLATNLSAGIAVLLLLVYLLITRFAQIAFR